LNWRLDFSVAPPSSWNNYSLRLTSLLLPSVTPISPYSKTLFSHHRIIPMSSFHIWIFKWSR
jgi:hypothetical protein